MKKIFFTPACFFGAVFPFLFCNFLSAQDTWTQKADFGGTARYGGAGFSIAGKGYMGLGFDGAAYRDDFWEYDPATDSWMQKANYPPGGRHSSTGYSISIAINNRGYVGTGLNQFGVWNDFWEFDPAANTWTQKANFAPGIRYAATGFSISDKGYLGLGTESSSGPLHNDIWEYDQSTDTWTQKANFGGAVRAGAAGFSVGSKGYIGTGGNAPIGQYYNDFWEFDPNANSWTQKANLPATGRLGAVGFGMNGKGYIGTGVNFNLNQYYNDLWEYDPANNSWTQQTNFAGTPRWGAIGFAIGNKGYIGTGNSGLYEKDFWEYAPATPPGSSCETAIDLGLGDTCANNITMTDSVMWFKFVADSDLIVVSAFNTLAHTINTITLYSGTCNGLIALDSSNGGNSDSLYYSGFQILHGTYYVRVTGSNNSNISSCVYHSDAILNAASCTTNTKNGGAWAKKSNTPVQKILSMGFGIGNYGYLGTGLDGAPQDDFHRWNPAINGWCSAASSFPNYPASTCSSPLASFSGAGRDHGKYFTICDKGYFIAGDNFSGPTTGEELWEYNTSNNIWTKKSDIPAGHFLRAEFVAFSIGTNGYVGLGGDNVYFPVTDFWKWDGAPSSPTYNQWSQVAPFPVGNSRINAIALTICNKAYVGGGTDPTVSNFPINDWWEYDPATNAWTAKAPIPVSFAIAIESAPVFSICCKGYVLATDNSLWEYDPVSDSWSAKTSLPASVGMTGGEVGFSLKGKGYVAGLMPSAFNEFWEWTPSGTIVSYIPPNPSFTAAPNTICAGGCVNFSINSPGNCEAYNWSFPGGNPSSSSAQNPVVCYSTAGSYPAILNVTSCGGCASSSTTITVTSPPPPPVISGPISDCTPPVSTYSVVNANPSLTYSWTVTPNGTFVGPATGPTVSVTWSINSNNQVGVITASASTGPGCTAIPSAPIYVYKCCQTFPVDAAFNNTSLTAVYAASPGLFTFPPPLLGFLQLSNKKIDVNGIFVVDQDLILTNCEWRMGIEAKIEILPGRTLILQSTGNNRTWLRAGGCDKMWNGIYILDNTAHLLSNSSSSNSIYQSTIQNARNAIVSQAGGDYQIARTVLQYNNIDMIVNAYGNHPGFIRQSILRTGMQQGAPNAMLQYFTAAVLNIPLSRTNIGIKINTVGDIQIGNSSQATYQNLFDKMDYGIYATTSKLRVYNNKFQNINTTTPLLSPSPNGIGVYLSGARFTSPPGAPPMGITVGGPGLQANTFTNTVSGAFIGFGVRVEKFIPAIDVSYNTFIRNNFSAVFVSTCPNAAITINNNNISENPSAPFIVFNAIACRDVAGSTATITNNTITDLSPSTSANKFTTGISVQNVIASNVNLLIQNNAVKFYRTGILLIGVTQSVSALPLVKANTVTFTPTLNSYASAKHTGIHIQGSTGITVDENIITRNGAAPNNINYAQTLRGISVENSQVCIVSENDITKMGDGIVAFQQCVGTIFVCNKLTSCFFGFEFQGPANIGNQPSVTNPFNFQNIGNRNHWFSNVSSGLRLTGSISPSIHWYYHTVSPNSYYPFPHSVSGFLGAGGNPELVQDQFDICGMFIAPPPPANAQQRAAMFGTIVQNQNQYLQDSAEFKYAERKFAYNYFKQHPSVLQMNAPEDNLYQNFYATHHLGGIGIFEHVHDLTLQNNIVTAISSNTSAPTSCTIESNQKTVNEIYLKTWVDGIFEFTSSDSATLYNIAYQSPLLGGDAVYGARVMLGISINDNSNGNKIMQHEISEQKNSVQVSKIYPNPNNGTMQLDYFLDDGAQGAMLISDLTGRKINGYKLENKINTLSISEGALKNGVYFYEINSDNKTIDKGKIVIIK